MGSAGLNKARDKMAAAGVDEVAIETFAHYYRLLEHGETGMVPESSIEPVDMELMQVIDDPATIVETIFRFYETRGFSPSATEREGFLYL